MNTDLQEYADSDPQSYTIEELAAWFCTETWELRALKVQNDWAQGHKMTKDEFKAKQAAFWGARIG